MKQNILMVDDHRENLIALESILEGEDRNLVMASSGSEALQLALKKDFALILLDVQMPDMDGFEVATLLRKNRKTQNIPIIFVTAISKESEYVFKGYECGAVDYLFKPINQKVLTAKVNIFLEQDMQKRRLQSAAIQMKKLKEQNERLLKAIGEGVIGVDENGNITFCNDAASNLFGRSNNEVEGGDIAQLLFRDSAGKQKWSWAESPMYKACQANEPWHCEGNVFGHTSDAPVPLEVKATPIMDESLKKPFTGCVVLVRDVSQRKALAEESLRREERRFPRKKIYKEMMVFNQTSGSNLGRLLNISSDGFKLLMRDRVDSGQEFTLGLILPSPVNGINTMSFQARVIWCEAGPGDQFRGGFQFMDLPQASLDIVKEIMERY